MIEKPASKPDIVTIAGLIAVALLFFAWFYWTSKHTPQPQQKAEPKQAAAAPDKSPPPIIPDIKVSPASGIKEETIVLSNNLLDVSISNMGGIINGIKLKQYREADGKPIELVSSLSKSYSSYPLMVAPDEPIAKLANISLYSINRPGPDSIEMTYSDGNNAIIKKIAIQKDSFILKYEINVKYAGQTLPAIKTYWGPGFGALSANNKKSAYTISDHVAIFSAGKYVSFTPSKKPHEVRDSTIDWVGIGNNYFAGIFLPARSLSYAKASTMWVTEKDKEGKESTRGFSELILSIPTGEKQEIFIGPKEVDLLKKMDRNLYRIVDWGLLSPIAYVLFWSMKEIYKGIHNYGIAIIILTFIIKLLFYPITFKSMVKMRQMGEVMKRLKPKMDSIKARYAKMEKGISNRQKMNEEIMALYQKEGVNPLSGMGGCLPLLLQMPIFFALFRMLPRAIELKNAPFFLWITDLSAPDRYYITPIVMGVTMLISTKMTSTTVTEPSQKMMFYFMPIMFTVFCLSAPSGLTLYWLVNNILSIIQQRMINKYAEEHAATTSKTSKKMKK